MSKLYFTKEHTQIAKGVAILLMIAHHLFAFPERIYINSGYISMVSLFGYDIEFLIGIFGKLCVAMYLFLSGYGIYMIIQVKGKLTYKEIFERIKKIYINYWVVFIIFIPIGFVFFGKNFNIKEFILNFIGLSSSYNGEWWFFRLYIELLLFAPLLKFIINDNLYRSIINTIALLVLGKFISLVFKIGLDIDYITNSILYIDIQRLLVWQASFSIGYMCAKFNIYYKVIKKFIEYNMDRKVVYGFICILVVSIRYIIGNSTIIDFILAPVFIFGIVNIIYDGIAKNIFVFLGKHSMNMWLTHSFFCYQYFQLLVFKPKVSIIIFVWLVMLSLVSSIFINYIIRLYNNLIVYKLIK